MHPRTKNTNFKYMQIGCELVESKKKRDLEVTVDSSVKTLTECAVAPKEARGDYKKGVENKIANIIIPLY